MPPATRRLLSIWLSQLIPIQPCCPCASCWAASLLLSSCGSSRTALFFLERWVVRVWSSLTDCFRIFLLFLFVLFLFPPNLWLPGQTFDWWLWCAYFHFPHDCCRLQHCWYLQSGWLTRLSFRAHFTCRILVKTVLTMVGYWYEHQNCFCFSTRSDIVQILQSFCSLFCVRKSVPKSHFWKCVVFWKCCYGVFMYCDIDLDWNMHQHHCWGFLPRFCN